MSALTTVHLVRHGEVHNPNGILYGRLPAYHLSDNGQEMAVLVANTLADHDVVHLRCSPLERAQQTMAPVAAALGAEGLAADVTMLVGNGYVPGHADLALDVLRRHDGVRTLFERRLDGGG